MSFSVEVIIISKEEEIFNSKLFMMDLTISVLVEVMAILRMSKKKLEPV